MNASGELPISMGPARISRATPKAVLVVIARKEVWIPQACIHDDSEIWKHGDAGKLVVKAWFARKMGWD